MRVLTGVEQLLARCQDWEGSAASHVSLKRELADVSALVSRWRLLELHSWPQLFRVRDRQFEHRASAVWVSLFDAMKPGVVASPVDPAAPLPSVAWLGTQTFRQWACPGLTGADLTRLREDDVLRSEGEQQLAGVFQQFDRFIRGGSVGEFAVRVRMVVSLARQLAAAPEPHRLAVALENLSVFYGSFDSFVAKRRQALCEPLEARLKVRPAGLRGC